jgi:endonuclease/exonuclease/phosphatase family metal-dependent hydrolase
MRTVILAVCLLLSNGVRAEDFRLGVWNIEKLSTRAKRGFPELRGDEQHDPRTDNDLQRIADYVADDVAADGLIVTEIDADDLEGSTELRPRSIHLSKVVANLGPKWEYFLGRTGNELRIGFMFNKDRIKLKKMVNLDAPGFKVEDEDVYDRDPFIVWISLLEDGEELNDLFLIGLHLKSQQTFIHNHMAAVAKLLGDMRSKAVRTDLGLPAPSDEDDIIIVGDCNDAAHKRAGFKYMFDYLEGAGFPHLGPEDDTYPDTRVNGSQIDHIFVSKKLLSNGANENSFKVHLVPPVERDAYRKTFSDHFPVTVDITAHDDDDPN